MTQAQIIVLDFGGQYCHLIARRIRQLNVYSEIKSANVNVDELKYAKGIILSGGPQNLSDSDALKCDPNIFGLGIPVLGICYGHQLMAHLLGGKVKSGRVKEYGTASLNVKDNSTLFSGLKDKETVWMSHGDTVVKLPNGFNVIGSTSGCETAAVANEEKKLYGLQFHPEVTHTPDGMKILENFVKICKCDKDWSMERFIDEKKEEIKQQVKEKNVFLLVSGGVDSTVVFTLLNKTLGEKRVYGLHIDNGFVRKDESKLVKDALNKHGFHNFHVVDASKEFLDNVKEIYDPEQKRKIIGETFIKVANNAVKDLKLDPDEWVLAQGTIYPDTIETAGTEHASKIKTHHNRVESVQDLIQQGKIIEPISQLYKDEVREVGIKLGLPNKLVWRHPFPGPGLAVRVLCADKEDKVKNADSVNKKINSIVSKFHLTGFVLPLKSVGVQGDARTYRHPAVLVGSADWETLEKASTEITNHIVEVNRVVWLLKPTKIKEVKVKRSYLIKERLDLVREADSVVLDILEKNKLMDEIWQFPVVLVPLNGESIVLRPVYSKEAMTAEFGKLPMGVINEMAERIMGIKGINAVFYDVTNKPPGTIEWE